jgi:hypothetical protein
MQKSTDKLFRKLFMGLVTLAVMLVFILGMHLLLGVPLDSKALWGGSVLTFLAINLILDLSGITKRLIVFGVSIVILGIFFNSIINWPLTSSFLAGLIIIVISGLLYISFLH